MKNHNHENQGQFKRQMTSRHLEMLTIGGVIGSGLFLYTGHTISEAGPLGTILAYLFGALMIYLVLFSLGELAVAMPVTGSFHTYATKFVSPGTGFTVAWAYWICWVVALCSYFVGAGLLMGRWFPGVPTWIFATIFAVIIFLLNILSIKVFAESEYYLSSVKVVAIALFIIIGLGAIFGLLDVEGSQSAPLFKNITDNELFPTGFLGVLSIVLATNYAFSGVELIGIGAGETDNPEKAVPQVIKSTTTKLVVFFILTIVVIAALLPMEEASVTEAPFVAVLDKIGVPFAADIMNFVIITALLSAANSGLYASARMIWSLSNEGMIDKRLVKINENGVPLRAILLSMVGVIISLAASVWAADTVFLVLSAIAGFAMAVTWLSIPFAQINYRKTLSGVKHKAPFLPYLTIFFLLVSIVGMWIDEAQRTGLYIGLVFVAVCYIYHYIRFKKF
ncbi:MAG: amino acid permease [Gemella sp.]|nr:amino acid permease [Gemella sp.]